MQYSIVKNVSYMYNVYEVIFHSGIFLTELILIAITVFRRSSFCHVNNHLVNFIRVFEFNQRNAVACRLSSAISRHAIVYISKAFTLYYSMFNQGANNDNKKKIDRIVWRHRIQIIQGSIIFIQ